MQEPKAMKQKEAVKMAKRLRDEGKNREDIVAALAAHGYRGRDGKPIKVNTLTNLMARAGVQRKGNYNNNKGATAAVKAKVGPAPKRPYAGKRARVKASGKIEAISAIVHLEEMSDADKIRILQTLV